MAELTQKSVSALMSEDLWIVLYMTAVMSAVLFFGYYIVEAKYGK